LCFIDVLAAGAQGLFTAHNAKGLGYAISQDDELKTVQVGWWGTWMQRQKQQ
jgi:hypothetical protein